MVTINDLSNSACLTLIESIHEKQHFDKKLFCNGILPLTPVKPVEPELNLMTAENDQLLKTAQKEQPLKTAAEELPPLPENPADPKLQENHTSSASIPSKADDPKLPEKPAQPKLSENPDVSASSLFSTIPIVEPLQLTPPKLQDSGRHTASNFDVQVEKFSSLFSPCNLLDSETVVRRHSISLHNRTPPRNSLAADILINKSSETKNSLISSIVDLHEALSDFNSCQEFSDSTSGSSSDDDPSHLETQNWLKSAKEKKIEKKKKRKLALTPGKEQFLKKQNTQISPK